MKNKNTTVHTYAYDGLGRPTADTATALGTNIDGAVRQIARSYMPRGMVERVTSYSNTAGTTVANDVLYSYDTFNRITTEYQARSALATTSSPKVQYTYTDGSDNLSRPMGITYPGGKQITYNYASGADNNLNRISNISDSTGTYSQYYYLGLGSIIKENYPTPNLTLDYTAGLDNFDRIAKQQWTKAGADIVHIQHTYDLAGNRLTRNDILNAASAPWSETYTYDGVNQIKSLVRPYGTTEAFTYDKTGNWTQYATNKISQTRTHNAANEITSIQNASSPSYDQVGNTTIVPKPDNLGQFFTVTYDAWNRVVKVVSGITPVGVYTYDGLNRRITKVASSETREFYYNNGWQCVEETVNSATDITYIWGLRYIDDLVCQIRSTDTLYSLQDANFNVVALTDASGTVLERYTYDAFGKRNIHTPNFTLIPNTLYPHFTRTFTGQVLDHETGFMLYRGRVYHTTIGRFVQRDPIGYRANDMNLYRYVGNRVMMFTDPSGLAMIGLPPQKEIDIWPPIPAPTPPSIPGLPKVIDGHEDVPPIASLPGLKDFEPDYDKGVAQQDIDFSEENFYLCYRTVRQKTSDIGNKCGCQHTEIYGDKSGLLVNGTTGGLKDQRGGTIPLGDPDWKCDLLQRVTRIRMPLSPPCEPNVFPPYIDKKISWGPAKGKLCKDATTSDVRSCLLWKPHVDADIFFNNCQTACHDAATGCCLSGFPTWSIPPRWW